MKSPRGLFVALVRHDREAGIRTAPAAGVPVKSNSDGQYPISPYPCYVGGNLTYLCYVNIKFRCASSRPLEGTAALSFADTTLNMPFDAHQGTKFSIKPFSKGLRIPKAEPLVAPTAGVAVKLHSDGHAYGECCREITFGWSECNFTLPLLCR